MPYTIRTVTISYEDRDWDMTELSDKEQKLLWRTVEIAAEAVKMGKEPFGALLADADDNILMEQGNTQEGNTTDCTGHAETTLMRKASLKYSQEEMLKYTLYTSAEPCCMCMGAMYWGYIGRLVYGARETDLMKNDSKNPTLDLPCRAVVSRGQRDIKVLGPFPEICRKYIPLFKK